MIGKVDDPQLTLEELIKIKNADNPYLMLRELIRRNNILKLEVCRITAMQAYLETFHSMFGDGDITDEVAFCVNLHMRQIKGEFMKGTSGEGI